MSRAAARVSMAIISRSGRCRGVSGGFPGSRQLFWSVMIVSARCSFRRIRAFSASSAFTRESIGRGFGPRRRPRISRRAPCSRGDASSSVTASTSLRGATARSGAIFNRDRPSWRRWGSLVGAVRRHALLANATRIVHHTKHRRHRDVATGRGRYQCECSTNEGLVERPPLTQAHLRY